MEFLNIKLFAFDIDGTLIPEDGSAKSDEPTTRLIKALIKLKIVFHPCTLAIATGRSVPEVYEFSTRFPADLSWLFSTPFYWHKRHPKNPWK